MPGSYNPPTRRHTTDSQSPSLSKPIYLVNTPTGVRPRDAPDSSDCKPIDPPLLTAPSTFSRAPTMLQRRRSYEASLAPSDSISQVSERRYQKQQQSHQRHYSSQQSPSYSYGGGRGANVIVLDSKGRMLPQRGQTYHSYVPQSQPSSPADSRGRVVYLQSGGGGKHTRSQSVPRNASSGQRYYYTESPPRASSPASPTKYVINGRTYTVMPSQPSRNHSTGSHSTSSSSTSKESMGHRIRRLLGMNSGSSASGGRRHTPPPNSSSRFIQW